MLADLQRLRGRPQSLGLLATLQEKLVRHISRRETRIRILRASIQVEKKRLVSPDGIRLGKAESLVAKARISRAFAAVDTQRQLLHLLRSIGDGIAFLYLDKWDIKAWARKEHAGFMTGKSGLRLELQVLRLCLSRGLVAILSDVTNCLRHGDVVVLKHGVPLVFECKIGSKDNARALRQQADTQATLDYLRTGKGHDPERPDWIVSRAALHSRDQHHRRTMARLAREALVENLSVARPEPGLCYIAATASAFHSDLQRRIKHLFASPLLYVINPVPNLPPYFYPATLWVPDPGLAWSLYTGGVTLIVLVDPNYIVRVLKQSGLTARFMQDSEWLLEITGAGSEWDGPMMVSGQFFARVAHELLSLRWFLREVSLKYAHGPRLAQVMEGRSENKKEPA